MEIHLCNFLIIESNRSNTIDAIAPYFFSELQTTTKCIGENLFRQIVRCFVFSLFDLMNEHVPYDRMTIDDHLGFDYLFSPVIWIR